LASTRVFEIQLARVDERERAARYGDADRDAGAKKGKLTRESFLVQDPTGVWWRLRTPTPKLSGLRKEDKLLDDTQRIMVRTFRRANPCMLSRSVFESWCLPPIARTIADGSLARISACRCLSDVAAFRSPDRRHSRCGKAIRRAGESEFRLWVALDRIVVFRVDACTPAGGGL
jgi:hypothetical protein